MVPQGAWRRMFAEFHANQKLGALVYQLKHLAHLSDKVIEEYEESAE